MNDDAIVIKPQTNLHGSTAMEVSPAAEQAALERMISQHLHLVLNPGRREIIRRVIRRKEAHQGKQGFLYTVTPKESTGRSPKDTYLVKDRSSEGIIDWTSPNNNPLDRETFTRLWNDALELLSKEDVLFVTDRSIGADPGYALPVRIVTDSALTCLFTLNMFRPLSPQSGISLLADKTFQLLVLPSKKLDARTYEGRLRTLTNGKTSPMAIAMDLDRRLGIVFGSAYGGSVKKLMFTVMNSYLPFIDVLPLHCSASETRDGKLSLFLGLSGTGKTSLSADLTRPLLGDDEHGWSERGVANFENGCYAKLIDLNPEKEPEIFWAVFHKDHCLNHGAIVENAMIFPDGTFDLSDDRLTPNSRASYPLTFLHNVKKSGCGCHPSSIIFLTADANAVLPPISRLNQHQAMLWYLMGYTSKLAGTERGVIDPVSVFSRFFAEPFMPLLPGYYTKLLGEKLDKHPAGIYLLNTGWTGGPYGKGKRMDINLTKTLLNAALSGELEEVPTIEDNLFHLQVPSACPGVSSDFLIPRNSWANKQDYDRRANRLADEFSQHYDRAFGRCSIPPEVKAQCPGK